MTEMQLGDQTIRYDRDATAAVYSNLKDGFAERCGCIFCKLNSWKEIAAYLNRDVTTVQRWEKREAMPIHRFPTDPSLKY